MTKKKNRKGRQEPDPRLNPETRIAPRFDSVGIAKFPIAEPGEMGFRILDDVTEEHIQ